MIVRFIHVTNTGLAVKAILKSRGFKKSTRRDLSDSIAHRSVHQVNFKRLIVVFIRENEHSHKTLIFLLFSVFTQKVREMKFTDTERGVLLGLSRERHLRSKI